MVAASEGAKPKLQEQASQPKKKRDTVEKKEDILEPYKLIEKLQAEVKTSQEQLKAIDFHSSRPQKHAFALLFKESHKWPIAIAFLSTGNLGQVLNREKEEKSKVIGIYLQAKSLPIRLVITGEFLVTKEIITGSIRVKYNTCVAWLENARKKLKYKLMKKRHSESLTEKQEAALKILELNQKIDNLSAMLAPRGGCTFNDLPPVDEVDRKFSLILELSAKVSAQSERIIHLESVLEEKEKKIQQLEANLKLPTFQMLEPITFQEREALTFQELPPLTYKELEPPTMQEPEKLPECTESQDSLAEDPDVKLPQKEIEEREKYGRLCKDRHESSGFFIRTSDPDSDEDEDYEQERRKRSLDGAAIATPTSLVEKDKELPRDFPQEEESQLRPQSSKASIPPPMYEEQDRPRSPPGPGNSFLANMGGTITHKIMLKYASRRARGLASTSRAWQALGTVLSVDKMSKQGGKIIMGDATGKGFASKKSDSNPLTEILKCPTKVVLLRNTVGAGEVDEDLEVETKEKNCQTKELQNMRCVLKLSNALSIIDKTTSQKISKDVEEQQY
ncbi:LOW QUALITY PROTEIN: coiled-coil domain-containing protein 192 [Sorex araneus]|uniref:LOW QUALITY PROTEIN: coiled-coil domain-containing protein 192 n=1 Tax=Sorex araneus TaxID=42254 RepID=UPI002433A790|nr:LOW QUALITY PROTEIN: coiled-coil domain-containing protein 192 [Sorex araneus]